MACRRHLDRVRYGRGGVAAAAAALVLLAPAGLAAGATPAADAAFAKDLSASIKPAFKKQAPTLVLGAVTCALPKKGAVAGAVARCIAHFSDPSVDANVVYGIKATLAATGTITWTTTTHYCTSKLTHKTLAC